VAFHAHSALSVDKTHRINVSFCLVICHYLWDDSLIGKERMSQPVGGNKVKVLNLEDVIVEAATELAISGECDVPMDNFYGGCDVFLPSANAGFMKGSFHTGVRFSIEDEAIHMFKFHNFAIAASVKFRGEMVSSSVLVAIAKEWL
jgi:hypothetical protein